MMLAEQVAARRWPLVGRHAELGLVGRLLADPDPGGLVVVGAAGTGKTRLVAESAVLARQRGTPVARVVASREAATVPLGAFAPLLPCPAAAPEESVDALRRVADHLLRLARERRLLLLVDDAHDLDSASATLLHQVASSRSVLVLATVRSGQGAPGPVVALWKDGGAARIELQPLSGQESAELLARGLGGQVDDVTAHQLWSTSDGNPLFLRELVDGAVRAGTLRRDSGVWALHGPLQPPASVRELVHDRVRGLPAELRRAACTLAIGDAVGLALLERLHPQADLAELEGCGLVQVEDDVRRRPVRLAHPMYGQVLRADAPRTRAAAVARRLAEEVERLGARRHEDLLRIAAWRSLTGGRTCPGPLALAARQAHHASDDGRAEQLARAALTGAADPEAALLLAQLDDEQGRHVDVETALACWDLSALPAPARVRAALLRSDNLFFGLDRLQPALDVLLETEGSLGPSAGLPLRARRAWLHLHAGRPRTALDVLAERPRSDTGPRSSTAVAASALTALGQTSAALHAVDAVVPRQRGGPAGDQHDDALELARGVALLGAGHLADAEAVAQRGSRDSLTDRTRSRHADWTHLLAAVLLAQGRVRTATASFAQAAAAQRRLAQPVLLRRELVGHVLSAAQAGAVPTMVDAMQELDRMAPADGAFAAAHLHARAWCWLARADRPAALDCLARAAQCAADAELVLLEVAVRHDLVRLGAHDHTARLAGLADVSDSPFARACAEHADAVAAGSAQRLARVASCFAAFGASLLGAEAYCAAAAVAEPRRVDGYARAADALVERCEGARTPGLAARPPGHPLTPREREVVSRAADGRSSRAIAADLAISVRTVDNLLQHAYDKLGVHSRAEAARVLALGP